MSGWTRSPTVLERPDYFATELLTDVWNKAGRSFEVRFCRRPLTGIFREAYGRPITRPWFLFVRATT